MRSTTSGFFVERRTRALYWAHSTGEGLSRCARDTNASAKLQKRSDICKRLSKKNPLFLTFLLKKSFFRIITRNFHARKWSKTTIFISSKIHKNRIIHSIIRIRSISRANPPIFPSISRLSHTAHRDLRQPSRIHHRTR